MPLFEVTVEGLQRRESVKFEALGMYERADLQRLLRDNPLAMGEDLLVISEEFGQWQDARRRIDLLALDPTGHLVVIELKRTDDGGHMELQALRYAAMVASMGFDEVLAAYTAHRSIHQPSELGDPRSDLESFLVGAGTGEDDDPVISSDVRILLVSANFGREITTAVLWLNRFDRMDIRCVRLVPYEIESKVFLDIQQVIPLPEAADYQVKLRRKDVAIERAKATDGRDFTRYHVIVDGVELPAENKRNAVRVMVDHLFTNGVPLSEIRSTLRTRVMRTIPGRYDEGSGVVEALLAADPHVDAGRWFTDDAWFDPTSEETYVLFKMWGRNTEPTLALLSSKFPDAKVTFRAADES